MTPRRHVLSRAVLAAGVALLSLALIQPAAGSVTPGTPGTPGTTGRTAASHDEPAVSPASSSAVAAADAEPCKIGKRRLVPSCGAYLGIGANPRAGETYDEAHLNWEKLIGRTADIAHYYLRGETSIFPTALHITRATEPGRERLLFINWKPLRTWAEVADGASDDYLRKVAENIKANYQDKFFLSLQAEMERSVNADPASGMTASDFREFFRHTVDVLRSAGVENVIFVVNYVGSPNWGDVAWFHDLFPGRRYVDWIAQDPYSFGKPPIWLSDFPGMVNRVQNPPDSDWRGFYEWASTHHPRKPMMLAEWGVDEAADDPNYKAEFFASVVADLDKFPRLKALVYWDAPYHYPVGDTRVDSSPQALKAFIGMTSSEELTLPGETILGRPAVPRGG